VKIVSTTSIEYFKVDGNVKDVLKTNVEKLFKSNDMNNFQRRLTTMIKKMNSPKYKHLSLSYLKLVNREYTQITDKERKHNIKRALIDIVELFSKEGIDVNCILDISFCSSTELKGACGFLATKSKLMMTRNKEYKEKLEKVANALGEIDKILEV
jgi:hypothetical protein